MAAVFQQGFDRYIKWQDENSDPRLNGYPFLGSPLPTALILVSYIIAVLVGPRIMKNRQAWDLKTYNTFYNLAQLIFCGYYVTWVYILTELKPNGHYLMCKILDRSDTPANREIALLQYVSLICRYLELSETIVHILRKKTRQLSYLHVMHHMFNVMMGFALSRFHPGGSASTLCLINFSVHFIMFSYYLATSSTIRILVTFSRFIKKYITIIQMTQFLYMLLVLIQDLGYIYPECASKSLITEFSIFCITADLVLFINFYRVNYLSKSKGKQL